MFLQSFISSLEVFNSKFFGGKKSTIPEPDHEVRTKKLQGVIYLGLQNDRWRNELVLEL